MARNLGLNELVDQALAAVTPTVFSDAGVVVGFAETGNAFEGMRYELARAISTALRQ